MLRNFSELKKLWQNATFFPDLQRYLQQGKKARAKLPIYYF
jgi:hypothetical protein